VTGVSRGRIYADVRGRIAAIVQELSPEELNRKVPATPAWTAKDVVAHLVGVVADITSGNLEGAGSERWTALQVEARRERSLEALLDEWAGGAPAVEEFLDQAPPDMSAILISDCYAHEQDIRGGTGRPGARDDAALLIALDFQIDNLGWRLKEQGLPGLKLRTGDRVWQTAALGVAAIVTAPDPFELLRCLHGRRSRAQLAALTWEGEGPDRYLDAFTRFPPAAEDIVE
jgi:uncharacterized protein (TIGR03083 family)